MSPAVDVLDRVAGLLALLDSFDATGLDRRKIGFLFWHCCWKALAPMPW
jgi:hypothetical protein